MQTMKTGFRDLDELTGGLAHRQLHVLASGIEVENTSLAANVLLNVTGGKEIGVDVEQGDAALLFSQETDKMQEIWRLASILSGVEFEKLFHGTLSDDERLKATSAFAELGRRAIVIDDRRSRTVSEMRESAKSVREKLADEGKKLGLVVVDNFQMILPDDKQPNEKKSFSSNSVGLKCMAEELDAPVLVLSYVSRAHAYRADTRPKMQDLYGFGDFALDATTITFLHNAELSSSEGEVAEAIVGKNRFGPSGTAFLNWFPKTRNFAPLAV